MRSRIQIVGSTVPTAHLPHRLLHAEGDAQVDEEVPGAKGGSNSLR